MNDATKTQRTAQEIISSKTEKEWETLSTRLTRYAFMCTPNRSWAEAAHLSQQALTDLIDPRTRTWDPSTDTDEHGLFRHLCKHVRNQRAAARMSAHRRRAESYLLDDGFDHDDANTEPGQRQPRGVRAPARQQDDALIAAERDDRKMKKIHERFANDKRVLEILELLARGVLTIAEHAEYLVCSHDEAYTARRRLAKFVAKLNEEMDKEDGDENG